MTVSIVGQQRLRYRVTGVVQGVGFRPFVYRLATTYGLTGFVCNDGGGVWIEVEGADENLAAFGHELRPSAPPLAHISTVQTEDIPLQLSDTFEIISSIATHGTHTLISPDLCVCDDCLRELYDPTNRRYRYPFINCTNCGPRFTITCDVPYDRPLTTMAEFVMCDACQSEYDDPTDRRFHAQPNACPACGPTVTFIKDGDPITTGEDALPMVLAAFAQGAIVAVKGLGGYHLACDATNDEAVQTLRERKGRPHKPFALMVRDIADVLRLAQVSDAEAALLSSRERPIVLLSKCNNAALSEWVAPNINTIGVMLPYTPLHYLLMGETPLVMTSANFSGEPIIKDDDEALAKLNGIADAFLIHNRPIHIHCDDSVVSESFPVRRSRGYAPFPVSMPFDMPPLLAVGGELKSTFCFTKGAEAFMSQHIGDMQNLPTLTAFEEAVTHLQAAFHIEPDAVICDAHPGYLSSRWAAGYAAKRRIKLLKVGHHHAHVAAVMAEHRLPPDATIIAATFDGTGYGDDQQIWGGEVFVGGYRHVERMAHLPYLPLPGGDAAVQRPYRIALAYLWASGMDWDQDLPPVAACQTGERRILHQQLQRNLNVTQTSSMGRFFDAVSALIGVCSEITYEGQAAIELEAVITSGISDTYPLHDMQINPGLILRAIVFDMRGGVNVGTIAAKFHNTIAAWVIEQSVHLRQIGGHNTVALSGGVFQNKYLLEQIVEHLQKQDFDILTHRLVPPNDGGLALGQAIIGHLLLEEN